MRAIDAFCAIVGAVVLGIVAAVMLIWLVISICSRIESEVEYRKNCKKGNLTIQADRPRRFKR